MFDSCLPFQGSSVPSVPIGHGEKIIHPSPVGSLLSFPSLDPHSDVILGAAGWEEKRSKQALPARMDCSPLGRPSERDPVDVPPVETVIAHSFVGHFVRVLTRSPLLTKQINSPFSPLLGASAAG